MDTRRNVLTNFSLVIVNTFILYVGNTHRNVHAPKFVVCKMSTYDHFSKVDTASY